MGSLGLLPKVTNHSFLRDDGKEMLRFFYPGILQIRIFYLVLRALDALEDDTSIAVYVKVPILKAFHQHIYDKDWHFSCGTKHYKVLMDQFDHVSTAFLELGKSYQESIEDITKRMGAGMAKFIGKEVETTDDYDEYCHYVAGLVGLGLSELFHESNLEDLDSDTVKFNGLVSTGFGERHRFILSPVLVS